MCDDLDSNDYPEDEPPEEAELDEEDMADLARELFGPFPFQDTSLPDDAAGDDPQPTAGERVLYALGQLHRLRRAGRLLVHPAAFSIEDLTRIVGDASELESATAPRGYARAAWELPPPVPAPGAFQRRPGHYYSVVVKS